MNWREGVKVDILPLLLSQTECPNNTSYSLNYKHFLNIITIIDFVIYFTIQIFNLFYVGD